MVEKNKTTRSKSKMVEKNKTTKASGSAVWSKEDEVSLLKAMVDFQDSKQYSPYIDMGKFLDFVRPYLHFDVKKRQLTYKLWRLRYKFLNSKFHSTIPHHAKLLEISNSIVSWGQHATLGPNVDADNVVADVGDSDRLLNGVENKITKTSGSAVWSQEDEVSLLKAMVDFQDSK